METNYDNLGNILALIHMCNNEIYGYPRLKLGVYTLSEGSHSDNVGLEPSFSYSFSSSGPFGPSDRKFDMDLEFLEESGWIDSEFVKREGFNNEHRLYKLKEEGIEIGIIAEHNLTDNQRENMKRVAEDIINGDSVVVLISKYAKEWDRQELEKLQEISLTLGQK